MELGPRDVRSEKQRVGRYWLFHPLAAGATATVHLGALRSDGGFSRAVAIKKLHDHLARDERLVASLLTEARIVARIRHPNVVSVLDVVSEAGSELIVLEYVHGESLAQLLFRSVTSAGPGPVPLPIALRIVVDALEGLHAAHEATNEHGAPLLVVHRDVSPQNVMVDADGRARIVDFGIAKALERPFTTNSSEFRGKLAYAAPEQIEGKRAIDRRVDLWAIGMVLWELVAGRRFFEDAEPGRIVYTIHNGTIPPPSEVRPCPPEVDAVVARALERDPDLRFGTAREMALALEKAGPLAPHREVGRWVREVARAPLEERSLLLDDVEAELRRLGGTVSDAPAPLPAAEAPADAAPARTKRGRWPAVLSLGVLALGAVALVLAPLGRASPARPAAPVVQPPVATEPPRASTPLTFAGEEPPPATPSAASSPNAAPRVERRHGRGPGGPVTRPAHARGVPAPKSSTGDDLGMDQRH